MTDRSGLPTIASRLTIGNTLVSGAVLLLAGIAFGVYDRTTSRAILLGDLSIQAQIVASNSVSALLFNDARAAEDTLAGLNAAPNIMSAEISGPDKRRLASFDHARSETPPAAVAIPTGQQETSRFEDSRIVLVRRILFQGKDLGTVSIASDYRGLNSRRNRYIAIVTAVLVTSTIAALWLSWLSQRSISEPIESLAEAANRVSGDKDYSVRASVKVNSRELAVLTDAFNDMLTQIQMRDRSLRAAHDDLEERVRERTAELDTVNKELEAFSYSVSHDLRAPLRHVIGFAGLLEGHAREGLDERSLKYLRTITEAAVKMGQLVDDLLEFSRIGRGQIAKRRLDLNQLVREAHQEVAAQYDPKQREVEWLIEPLPEVDADPALLRLVMINLMSNAVKYSAPRERSRIDIGAEETSGEVIVFVRDNGVGFDMQYAHKLFGVFQRLHSSEEFEGTGIGLANVRRIVTRHGGRVWAESVPDRGATFYFSLPVKGQPT